MPDLAMPENASLLGEIAPFSGRTYSTQWSRSHSESKEAKAILPSSPPWGSTEEQEVEEEEREEEEECRVRDLLKGVGLGAPLCAVAPPPPSFLALLVQKYKY
jgi:hypothetical protein